MPLLTGSAADAWFRHFFVGDREHIHSFYALVNFDCSKIVHSMLFKWRERKKRMVEKERKRERGRRERENKRKRERRGCIHLINLTTTKQNIYCTDERIENLTRMATRVAKHKKMDKRTSVQNGHLEEKKVLYRSIYS